MYKGTIRAGKTEIPDKAPMGVDDFLLGWVKALGWQRFPETERLEEFLSYYKPGEHGLTVEQRLPAPASGRGPALASGMADNMVTELEKLARLYRYTVWSKESDFLFGG